MKLPCPYWSTPTFTGYGTEDHFFPHNVAPWYCLAKEVYICFFGSQGALAILPKTVIDSLEGFNSFNWGRADVQNRAVVSSG